MLTPTVGRQVHYFDDGAFGDVGTRLSQGQPLAATISHIISDKRVNLAVIDMLGQTAHRVNILLLAEGDERPSAGEYCVWPDLSQAAAGSVVAETNGKLADLHERCDQHRQAILELQSQGGATANQLGTAMSTIANLDALISELDMRLASIEKPAQPEEPVRRETVPADPEPEGLNDI